MQRSEKPTQKRRASAGDSRSTRIFHWLRFWSAWLFAFAGFVLMTTSSHPWYWFSPMFIPVFILLPGKMKRIEEKAKEKKRRKAERRKKR